MKKVKHSKLKNTGILFELLTRQIAADILSNKSSPAKDIVLKYFNESTMIGKECRLYKLVVEAKVKTPEQADRLVEVAIQSRKKISESKLSKEKYSLIGAIKESYDLDNFFKGSVSNYKVLASLYKLFEDSISESVNDPEDICQARETILESITRKSIESSVVKGKDLVTELSKQDEELRLLTYRLMVDTFNRKYSTVLSEGQRRILSEYINNISNTSGLKDFVCKDILEINKKITTISQTVPEQVVKIKLAEVSNLLNSIQTCRRITDNHIIGLLIAHELVSELYSVQVK